MSKQITITLPDRIARRVNEWAEFSQVEVTDMVAAAIDVGLPELSGEFSNPISELDDASVLAMTEIKIAEDDGRRLSNLLEKQREGTLMDSERPELSRLMQTYHELWVRQSQAFNESVHRGLLPLLDS